MFSTSSVSCLIGGGGGDNAFIFILFFNLDILFLCFCYISVF